MQSNTLAIGSAQQPERALSRSRSIRELSRRRSSSKSEKNTSIHSKIRKASAHQFAREAEEFQAAQKEKKHPLKAVHSLPLTQEALCSDQKDPFLQSRIYDELETHFQRLGKEGAAAEAEELEELEYTTFRMVKREEKSQLGELRLKLLPKCQPGKP